MNLGESIMSAFSGIMGNKTRSILTMFGIVVGIASVIMITSVGEGYRNSINSEFEAMGLDKVTVGMNYSDESSFETEDYLTLDDLETILKYDDIIDAYSTDEYGFGGVLPLPDGEEGMLFTTGVTEAYYRLEPPEMVMGRIFTEADMENASNAVIIDADFANSVFGTVDCIGERIPLTNWMAAYELTVVGVTASTEDSAMMLMWGYHQLYMPLSSLQNMFLNGSDMVGTITAKVKDADRIPQIGDNLVRLIEMNHDNEDKYRVSSVASRMEEMDSVIGIFTAFMSIVAGISLLVGGIGVMNIMLVSVTERTREIGIRKSLGATNFNIQFQFLIEALILTAIGGVVGMIFGYLGGMLFGVVASMVSTMGLTPSISIGTVLLVVAISAGIGIVFGVYPAAAAARLDPIEALRFE